MELLPCPFCGSDDISIFNEIYSRKFKFVGCWQCGCRTQQEFSEKSVIKAWNNRPEQKDKQ